MIPSVVIVIVLVAAFLWGFGGRIWLTVLARVGLFVTCACIIAVIALAIWSAQPARPAQVSYHPAPATVEPGLTIAEQDARYRSARLLASYDCPADLVPYIDSDNRLLACIPINSTQPPPQATDIYQQSLQILSGEHLTPLN